jgi:hydrogenase maturation protein HypF
MACRGWSIESPGCTFLTVIRKRFVFRGTIQGVGFRPAIYRLADSLGLGGFVQNRRSEVVAEVQGGEDAVGRFTSQLAASLPPAARIASVTATAIDTRADETRFQIVESAADIYAFPPIPPDLPVCADCTRELLDPSNRRHLYPFITCTQCGPRYSIVSRTPFDRENTSMRPFPQCRACAAEYADPADRRFHSQTNSCPVCGPRLSCVDSAGRALDGDPLSASIGALTEGKIVAVEGIGGFHLAADPRHQQAMARLRREKERERKPFALMVRDIEEARAVCVLSQTDERLLASPEAPIVIAPRKPGSPPWLIDVSDTETLGIMLPYTPLHLLLFRHPRVAARYGHLVMTSGNRANEPIITDPEEAREKLGSVADVFLSHDRRIVLRTDDSIVRAGASSAPFLLRRSRGYVPRQLTLASEVRGVVLGVGGDLKNAPALARGRSLHLCPFNGDLDDPVTLAQFDEMISQVLDLYDASPDLVVRDMHPLYHSSRWAREAPWRGVALQHHFAHALSVMAEHGLEEVIALTFDGTGYGTDGTVWGGEFLHATRQSFTRLGSFAPFRLPGGEAAILNPSRIAFALLADGGADDPNEGAGIPGIDTSQRELLRAMLDRGVNSPVTTSLGRVFDAAAAILGLVDQVSYEGEGPIRLEGYGLRAFTPGRIGLSEGEAAELLPLLPSRGDERQFLVDPRPLLSSLLMNRNSRALPALSLFFHEAVARASLQGARKLRQAAELSRIALSGGVFQNLLLRELLVPLLIKEGFEVFLNVQAPPGDGGLSVGQAWFQES